MVGAIGFEPTPAQPFQTLAGLGWQPKYRNGSQRNNYWTRIGHSQFASLVVLLLKSADLRIMSRPPGADSKQLQQDSSADSGKVLQNPHRPRTKKDGQL